MVSSRRIRLNKAQREAEGYLELGLPHLALDVLTRLGNPAVFGPPTLYLWGETLRALGRYGDALEPLQRASQADPENIHIWLALAWCHKRTGRVDLAVDAMSSALAADPNEALLHYNLACYLSMSGEKNRAWDICRKRCRSIPNIVAWSTTNAISIPSARIPTSKPSPASSSDCFLS